MPATLADVHPDNLEVDPVRYSPLAVARAHRRSSEKPAGSTTIAAMALVSDGTVFSHGLDPIVELHTYDFAGRLLPDGTVFDAPVTISGAGGAGCVVTPALNGPIETHL